MKKIMMLFVLATVLFTGCSKKDSNSDALKCEFVPADNTSVTLVPGEAFDVDELGLTETTEYMEAASCYYEGMDKIFTYDNYAVTTYPKDGKDYIQDISITAEGVTTDKGVGVGSDLKQVLEAYGENYELSGKMYKYAVNGEKYLYFFIMNDVVKSYGYAITVN